MGCLRVGLSDKKALWYGACINRGVSGHIVKQFLPDYPVQNIYDIFSFEEPAWPHGNGKLLKRCSSRGNFDKERHREKAYQHSTRNDSPADAVVLE